MTENTQTDEAGIARSPTGEINQPIAQPAASSGTTTPPTPTETPKTLLNEQPKTPEPEGAKAPAPGAPEKYEDFKVPEGYTLDADTRTKAEGLFKAAGLNQEQSQAFVDFWIAETREAFNAPFNAYKDLTDKWRQDSESHPDLKGKLAPGQEVHVRIGRFLNQLDPQLASDFKELMDLTGAGNHQAFIRVIDYAAKKLTEGGFVAGRGPSAEGQRPAPNRPPPSAAEAMWPNLVNRTQPQ